jgi:hypothetical protein
MFIHSSFLRKVAVWGLFAAAIRIGVFWYLFVRHAGGDESIDELLLFVLLLPEGLGVPRNWFWTVARGIEFSGALLVGSVLMTAMIAATLRIGGGVCRSDLEKQ